MSIFASSTTSCASSQLPLPPMRQVGQIDADADGLARFEPCVVLRADPEGRGGRRCVDAGLDQRQQVCRRR
jgi:hypothetical protein